MHTVESICKPIQWSVPPRKHALDLRLHCMQYWAEGLKKLNATLEEAMARPDNMNALLAYHTCSTAVYPTLESLKAEQKIRTDIVSYSLGVESATASNSK